jgi:hypothetical protein
LAGWQLGSSIGHPFRVLTVTLVCALAVAVPNWLAVAPMYLFGDMPGGFGSWLMNGLLTGTPAGLAFGAVYGLVTGGGRVFEPSRVRVRLWGRRSRAARQLVRTVASRFAVGTVGGFAGGLGVASEYALESALFLIPGDPRPVREALIKLTAVDLPMYGVTFGLTAGLVLALMAVLETPLDTGSAVNRATVVRQVLVLAPTICLMLAFGSHLVIALLPEPPVPVNWTFGEALFLGAVGGFGGALSYALGFTAWGQWVLMSRVWLPLTGRLPWATVAFLKDAYDRGVLRQAGAVYQFRHARLKDHLRHTRPAPAADDGRRQR